VPKRTTINRNLRGHVQNNISSKGATPPNLGANLPPTGGFTSQDGCVKECRSKGVSVTFSFYFSVSQLVVPFVSESCVSLAQLHLLKKLKHKYKQKMQAAQN